MEYVIPQNTSIRDVAMMYADIGKLLAIDANVTIDTSLVARIDTPVVQLLAIVNEEIARKKGRVCWGKPSSVFVNSVELLGLSACFENGKE